MRVFAIAFDLPAFGVIDILDLAVVLTVRTCIFMAYKIPRVVVGLFYQCCLSICVDEPTRETPVRIISIFRRLLPCAAVRNHRFLRYEPRGVVARQSLER